MNFGSSLFSSAVKKSQLLVTSMCAIIPILFLRKQQKHSYTTILESI